jgi:AraC-like DNA-binding protein
VADVFIKTHLILIFKQHIPLDPLNKLIESIIYFKNYQPEHKTERVVPDGLTSLIIELDGKSRSVYDNEKSEPVMKLEKAWLSGIKSQYLTIQAIPDSEMIVVRFKPGGIYPFFQKPAELLTNRIQTVEELAPFQVIELRESIKSDASLESKISSLENWLEEQIDYSLMPEPLIEFAIEYIQSNSTEQLQKVVTKSRYSKKQFIHLFKKYVGLTPKLFQRIIRFNEILRKVEQGEFISWTQVSADCGYYDQAHFIRDFKLFSGFNPTEFLRNHLENERINFFPYE